MTRQGYQEQPSDFWRTETQRRIGEHPVLGQASSLLVWIDEAWRSVWETHVGSGELCVPFRDLSPRAQIVGDFFESVLALRLSQVGPWRRGTSKEKDLIFTGARVGEFDLDFEIKTSGQATGKIYGNRSYAQPGEDGAIDSASRKKRSGFYLCVNFWEQSIYLVRVGWLDAGDWEPQKSATGQMAGLKEHVYRFKLLPVPGTYYLEAPLLVLDGLGKTTCAELEQAGFGRVNDILDKTAHGSSKDSIASELEIHGVSRRTARRAASALVGNTYFAEAAKLRRLDR